LNGGGIRGASAATEATLVISAYKTAQTAGCFSSNPLNCPEIRDALNENMQRLKIFEEHEMQNGAQAQRTFAQTVQNAANMVNASRQAEYDAVRRGPRFPLSPH